MPETATFPHHVVGIDLGTSHVAVAHREWTGVDDTATPLATPETGVHMLPIPQLVGVGQVGSPTLLPSLRYHPAVGELDAASLNRPWPSWQPPENPDLAQAIEAHVYTPLTVDEVPAVLGAHARNLGAQVPTRLVSSAKSWLSHAGVDRTAPILPWGAPPEVARISPLHATASYLAHVQSAWQAKFPNDPLASQAVTITVPASFDEGARALTLEAAKLVGLPHVQLLEEPQAAMVDWLHLQGAALGEQLRETRLVLVADVGGGTTDFSLMAVSPPSEVGGWPQLSRLTVGEHLMLGGDNMDLAIAHALEAQLVGEGGPRLNAARFAQLLQQSRAAKEQLLAADAPEAITVTLLGVGSKVMGGSRSVTLTREQVHAWVVDGFMPRETAQVMPKKRQSGLVSFGLPYPADSAITRHLAAFLARSADAMRQHLGLPDDAPAPLPDALLLNGGVFHAHALGERLAQVLGDWRGAPVQLLRNPHPDWAVARGAAWHQWQKLKDQWVSMHSIDESFQKKVIPNAMAVPRIQAGSARSYFLLLEEGDEVGTHAVCLLPHGQVEGEAVTLPQPFALRLGQSVRFQLLACSDARAWVAGERADVSQLDAVWLPPLVTRLQPQLSAAAAQNPLAVQRAKHAVQEVVVRLRTQLSEVGTLEVACVSAEPSAGASGEGAAVWPLSFSVRGAQRAHGGTSASQEGDGNAAALSRPLHWSAVRADVLALIATVFGDEAQAVEVKTVRQLRQSLEKRLGPRDAWPVGVLRPMADALLAQSRRRRRSAEHERVWFNLTGFCLRPGVGAQLDAERMAQVWALQKEGLSFPKANGNWAEWWVFWRRVAAGLSEAQQMGLMGSVAGHMENADQRLVAKDSPLVAYADMIRLVAVLENMGSAYRAELGEWLMQRLAKPQEGVQTWWALGRTGSRVPLHGSPHNVVSPELVRPWLEHALAQDWRRNESAMFAAVQMARMTGDRARDIDDALRLEVLRNLQHAKAPERWLSMVREVQAMDGQDMQRMAGETLPPGLRMLSS